MAVRNALAHDKRSRSAVTVALIAVATVVASVASVLAIVWTRIRRLVVRWRMSSYS